MTAPGPATRSPFEDETAMAYVLSILRRGLARTREASRDDPSEVVTEAA